MTGLGSGLFFGKVRVRVSSPVFVGLGIGAGSGLGIRGVIGRGKGGVRVRVRLRGVGSLYLATPYVCPCKLLPINDFVSQICWAKLFYLYPHVSPIDNATDYHSIPYFQVQIERSAAWGVRVRAVVAGYLGDCRQRQCRGRNRVLVFTVMVHVSA